MQINPQIRVTTPPTSSLGKALQAGVVQSVSTATGDVLELSGLSQVASALGPEGIAALRNLKGTTGLTDEQLGGFIAQLTQSGTGQKRVGDLLGMLSNFNQTLGSGDFGDLFSRIESRGISGELKYLDSLDNLFNLGQRDVAGIFNAGSEMSNEEFDVYLKSVTRLLQAGVIGTETVDVNGNPTQVFIENEIGSDYARMPLYRQRFPV